MSEGKAKKQGWIRRLVGYMAPHKKNAYIAFGVAIGGQLIQSLLPVVQKVVIDDVITKHDKPLAPWLTLMIAMGVLTFVFAYNRRFRGGRIALDVQHDLRTAIFRQLQHLDFARHDEMSTGQLVSRASSDVALVQGFLQFLPIGVANMLLFVVSLTVMFILSVPLALVMLAVAPLLLITAMRLRTSVFPASWDAQQKAGDVANVVEEDVTGVRVVKGFGQEARELQRLSDRSELMFASRVRLVNIQARLQPAMQTIPAFGQVAVLALGGWLALHHHITLGTFFAFASYMLLIAPPVRQLAAILTVGQLARAGAERIYDLLDSTPHVQDRPGAVKLHVERGAIDFDHVTFGYTSTEPVLRDFNLNVAAGETVALVGGSGSGKSTVGLLLPRFYDVHSGTISIDGVDVRDATLQSLRGSIGVVFEDSFLFSDSITENIAFGRPDATKEEVETAARAAEAHEFIMQLPRGYETVVGEQGLTLSGGQRQRVALARALLSDPEILLLDDATSSVDARIEEEIHATLRRISAHRTTILIAHRRSTLSLADRIIVVDQGRVVDAGTNEELTARCRLYRLLLSGPGDDAEGIDAVEEDVIDDTRVDGITPSAWRGLDHDELRGALIADRTRTTSPAAMRFGGPGGGGGGGAGGGAAWGGALAPTPELLAQVDALEPADADPKIDVGFEARPAPDFTFLGFLRRYRGWLFVGMFLVALDAVCTLAGPLLVKYGLDHGVAKNVPRELWIATFVFFVITLFDWWVMWAEARVMGRISERLLHALRIKVFAHLQRLGVDYYENEMAGRIMTRMTTDIDALSQLLQNGLVNALVNLVTFLGVGVALAFINPRLALVSAVILPPLVIATLWFRRQSSKAYEIARERMGAVNANLQEGLSGVRVSQAFVREERNQDNFEEIAGGYRDARVRAQRLVAIYFPFVDFLSDIAVCLVLGAGSVFVAHGSLTSGALIAFLLYLNLFFAPIQQLSQVFDSYQQASVAIERITELLETPTSLEPPAHPVPVPRLTGDVTFDDVRFRYRTATADALRGVDLRIRPGETVALVGETGAGKSTVIKLVARFYDPTSGFVKADGVPVNEYEQVPFHQQLGVVPQEAFLFSGTIRDNIAYGRDGSSDAAIEAAARAVGAHEFIAGLPGGYLQWVSERGRSLSSGQRQLIALARAHLVDPAILLLDEATSNLDLQTEARVQAAMGVAARGRTTILIAHRLQTARLADRIVVIDRGVVIEDGTHDELLRRRGAYARMWASAEGEPSAAAN
ncbi:MAG: ATP-binding cassette, subfamily bacterial [Actinomycetota bacterium]|nr:ATP-binding cassette, subfamily bacterial [Actinomycetota bacterium]